MRFDFECECWETTSTDTRKVGTPREVIPYWKDVLRPTIDKRRFVVPVTPWWSDNGRATT